MKLPSLLALSAAAAGLLALLALGWVGYELARDPALGADRIVQDMAAKEWRRGTVKGSEGLLSSKESEKEAEKGESAEVVPFAELAEALQGRGVVPGEVLLTFKSPEALAALRARAGFYGLEILSVDPRLRTARVRYRDLALIQKELNEHAGDYQQAGPNYMAWVPGLPAQQGQTDASNAGGTQKFNNAGLAAIGATGDRSQWGNGVTVAVLDTGITDHSALAQVKITHLDLVKDGQPFDGHGTAMASLISGEDAMAAGVAPKAKILDVRVADAKGESNTMLLASGIVQAVDQGARVLNISLGSAGDSAVLRQAIQYAMSRNVVVVAAAGNEQMNALSLPAGYPGVISVAAVDASGAQASFSNSGSGLTLAAPGVGIVSAYSDGRLVIGSGTSQSTALVSGVAATVLGWGYQPQNLADILSRAAKPTGAPAEQVGAGVVQVPTR